MQQREKETATRQPARWGWKSTRGAVSLLLIFTLIAAVYYVSQSDLLYARNPNWKRTEGRIVSVIENSGIELSRIGNRTIITYTIHYQYTVGQDHYQGEYISSQKPAQKHIEVYYKVSKPGRSHVDQLGKP